MDQFMQPEITTKQRGWRVETRDNGTCFVPGDVYGVPDWLAYGVPLAPEFSHPCGDVFEMLRMGIVDYLPATCVESIEVCEGYFARLTAPGYMDCTEWTCYKTHREARDALKDI